MKHRRADITIDQAMSQMDLASSGSSSESSIADSSDLASFSKDGNEDDYSLDSSVTVFCCFHFVYVAVSL